MRNQYLLAGVSCLAITTCGQAAAQSAPNQKPVDPANAISSAQVDEIVVTASRRSENIREVPTAVSAYSGTKLKDAQIASLTDLVTISPNIQISTFTTSVNINIRGIGAGNLTNAGGDPGVAVHADGVYLGQPGLAVTTFLDIARVEILRGPQGTLFGRNATGGAINIIPNTPTKELSYGVDVTAGADPTMVRSSGYISGPLNASGDLLARVSVAQNDNEGFTRNLAPGGPSRLDGISDYAARAQLEWRPSDSFDARLLVEYQKEQDAGPADFLAGTPANTPVPVAMQGFPTGDPKSHKAYANVGTKDLEAKTVSLTADWSVGGGHLKALASYNTSNQYFAQDGDGTAAPYTYTTFGDNARQQYGELLYTSDPSKKLSYVVGGNYFHEDFNQTITVPTAGYPFIYVAGGNIETKSYALFSHAQYEFLPSAKLFAGLRYTHDDKKTNENNLFLGTGAQHASWSDVTYEAGLSYDFSPAIAGYAKYATGYKSGGFSVGSLAPAFNPETNTNIEVGLKGSYLGGALQANLASFHMTYENLQVNQIVGASSFVTNAARAAIDGVEVETVIRPIEHLRIEASGAWLNARFNAFLTDDSSRPQLGLLDLAGHQLPGAPHYNASLGAFYDLPVSSGTFTLGGRYNWKSRIYFSEFNIPISSQSAAGKLDLYLNFKSANQRWKASLFALNATDAEVKSNVIVVSAFLGSLALAQYQPGRQVGVSVGYDF